MVRTLLERWRQVPFVPQMESVECGPASLAMVLGYHGHHAPLSELREVCAVSREGANALSLVLAARRYGCEAEAVQAGMDDLASLPLPAILHWGFGHFVVLERVAKHNVTILDPRRGRTKVPLTECSRFYTGVALILAPTAAFKRRPRARPSLKRYRTLLSQMVPALSQIFGASALLLLVAAVFPAANQFLVDHVIVPRNHRWLWALGLALAIAALARSILSLVRGWSLQQLQVAMDFSLMTSFLSHLLHVPVSFFLHRPTGDLAQRVQAATVVRTLVASRSVATLLNAMQLIGYAALMVAYHARLAAIVCALGAVRLPILLSLRRAKRQLMTAEQAAAGRESAALVEAFSSLETTKACGAEGYVFAHWADRAAERVNSSLPLQNLGVASGQFMAFVQTIGLAIVFWIGGREVVDERMTLGTFTAFLTLQAMFLGPLGSILATVDELQYVSVLLMRVDDVLEASPERTGTTIVESLAGTIELQNVSFAYNSGGPPVLQGIDLTIHSGEKIALVGRTGSGKSTLARVLLGMHQEATGRVCFDGHDYRDLDLACLRNQVGVVLQETFLFDDTIRANICLGHADASEEDLESAVWYACIDEFIHDLPDGFDTRVGENGQRFSAGQRQRLALARALVHRPRILLLDEATSALDIDTEARIHARLAALRCTRIVITHRVAAVRDADRVVVLEGGRIVQSGPYDRLVREPGLFGEMLGDGEQALHQRT